MNIAYELTGVASKTLTQEVGISLLVIEANVALVEEKIEVVLRRNTGKDVVLIDEIKIDDFLEQMTEGEDIYIKTKDRTLGVINLTEDKGISLDLKASDNEYLEINLSGLATGSKYSIDGIETYIKKRSAISYDVKTMRDRKTKFDTQGYGLLLMPIGQVTPFELLLTNGNGQSIEFTQRELQLLATLNGEVKGLEDVSGSVTVAGTAETVNFAVDITPMFQNKDFIVVVIDDVNEVQIKGEANLEYTLVKGIEY